ncbi:MAG: hypothetical protein JWN13_1234 [Betaproteobacteria bacterium]|nr:hypothetical protein [Betaproteobacteria bacterium]
MHRREFLQRFVAISTEVDQLESLLGKLCPQVPECQFGEFARMMEWARPSRRARGYLRWPLHRCEP